MTKCIVIGLDSDSVQFTKQLDINFEWIAIDTKPSDLAIIELIVREYGEIDNVYYDLIVRS